MPNKPQDGNVLQGGVNDVVHSVGSLVHSSIDLAEKTAEVVERELAMVIRLSQRVRDEVISAQTLADARKQPIPARFREDAHAIVDLMADLGAVLFQTSVNFVEGLAGRDQQTSSHSVVHSA